MRISLIAIAIGISGAALAQTTAVPPEAKVAGTGAIAHPEIWPAYKYPVPKDAKAEAMIADLLKRMTIEEKIGQLVQGDISAITPADMKTYHLGSVLAGGSACGHPDDRGVCAWRGGAWRELAGASPAVGDDGSDARLVDGPVDALVEGGQVRVIGARALGPARPWDADAQPITTDLAGHVWGVARGALVRG